METKTATRIAEEFIASLSGLHGSSMILLRQETLERDFGWVFFYGPDEPSVVVAGNARSSWTGMTGRST